MNHQMNIDEAIAIAYDYVYMQNILIKLTSISFIVIILMILNRINNTIQI